MRLLVLNDDSENYTLLRFTYTDFMFCVQPFVVPVCRGQIKQIKRVFDSIDAKIYVRPLSIYYNYGRDAEKLQILFKLTRLDD